MEELKTLAQCATERYFNVLQQTGYINDSDVNKLLLLLFLNDFLNGYSYYITDEDYAKINSIIRCLSNTTCLVPYMEYKEIMKGRPSQGTYRITTEDVLRDTQDYNLRLVN